MYLDICITGGLTEYKSDIIKGTFVEKYLGNTTIAIGKSKVLGYWIAHYILWDYYDRTTNLYVLINYLEGYQFQLVWPK